MAKKESAITQTQTAESESSTDPVLVPDSSPGLSSSGEIRFNLQNERFSVIILSSAVVLTSVHIILVSIITYHSISRLNSNSSSEQLLSQARDREQIEMYLLANSRAASIATAIVMLTTALLLGSLLIMLGSLGFASSLYRAGTLVELMASSDGDKVSKEDVLRKYPVAQIGFILFIVLGAAIILLTITNDYEASATSFTRQIGIVPKYMAPE